MDDKNNEKLLDRIEYYMEYPADEEKIDMMFSTGEKNILRTIREFEKIRYEMKWKNEKPVSKEDNARTDRGMAGHSYMVSLAKGKKSDCR